MSVERVGDLEVDQDMDFQRRQWTVERVGWVVMALLIVAGLLGVFGSDGPLSKTTAGEEGGGLWVDYNRFERSRAETRIRVHVGAEATGAQAKEARVWLDRKYVESLEVHEVVPEPERVEIGDDRLTYVFPLTEPGAESAVTFQFQPEGMGKRAVRLGVEGGDELEFWQFVYP